MDVWMNGWMGEWMDEWMDGRMLAGDEITIMDGASQNVLMFSRQQTKDVSLKGKCYSNTTAVIISFSNDTGTLIQKTYIKRRFYIIENHKSRKTS